MVILGVVIPGRGVRKIVRGYLKLQDVSLYIHTATIFALSIEEGGTYSELVCMGINILLYMFVLIYVYKYVCMCICMCIFPQKNIEGLL